MKDTIPASEEVVTIIRRNFESKALDYKGPIEWNARDKKACCEIVKDVIAMANTEGGFIVIGVSEVDDGFQLEGVTSEQAATFESSQICRFVQNYADPPINLRIQKISHQDLLYVIIEVPPFPDTPHICQKAFPEVLRERELYVRTDNNESAPIRSSADFRALIERAIRNRTDSLLSAFRAILTGVVPHDRMDPTADDQFRNQIQHARDSFEQRNPLKEKQYKYYIETIFQPEQFDQYRLPPNRLESAARRAHVDFVGWPFLFFHYNRIDLVTQTDDGLESLINTQDFANVEILDFWRLNESGLFYKKELTPTSHTNPPEAAAPRIVWQFAEAISCMTRLYEELLPDAETMTLTVSLSGTRGRVLTWREIGFNHPNYKANRPTIEVSASHSLAEWRAGLEDHVVALSKQVFRHFQLGNPDESRIRTQVQNIFQRRLQ